MDKKIREAIIGSFKNHPTRSQDSLMHEINNALDVSRDDVLKNILWMKDAGELEMQDRLGTWRLTLTGLKTNASLYEKAMEYLADHWLAIAALIISLVALFKN
jgi:DNA polymerase III psi subunit